MRILAPLFAFVVVFTLVSYASSVKKAAPTTDTSIIQPIGPSIAVVVPGDHRKHPFVSVTGTDTRTHNYPLDKVSDALIRILDREAK